MKLLLTIILTLNITTQALAFEQDKIKHVLATGAIAGLVSGTMRSAGNDRFSSFLVGMVLSNMIGHMKEQMDPVYDQADINANILGSVIGASFAVSF